MQKKTLRAEYAAHRPLSSHRVVLIPGFLGFNALGDFSYFARQVGQTLANALADADPGRMIEVDAVETIPAGSLEFRQETLITQLANVRREHPGAQLHLVGHSTGGLDAELLVRTPPAGQQRNAATDEIRRAIRSIVCVAAPLAGSSLAKSPLAQFTSIDSFTDLLQAPLSLLLLRGPRALVGALAAVLRLLGTDTSVGEIISGLLHSGNVGATYLLSLLLSRDLIRDLAPEEVGEVVDATREDPALSIHRRRFLTIARRDPDLSPAGVLFRLLYDTTAREATEDDPSLQLVRAGLEARRPQLRVIGEGSLPELTYQSNDGIVDTLRQTLPVTEATVDQELSRVAAFVIADHIDVIGYYQGANGGAGGFLTSGSNFRGNEFDVLYRAIAEEVVYAIGVAPRAAPDVPQTV